MKTRPFFGSQKTLRDVKQATPQCHSAHIPSKKCCICLFIPLKKCNFVADIPLKKCNAQQIIPLKKCKNLIL